jgi:hypothetical protein
MMREKPIIMGADSVRAILDGRKTQTRRVIKPQPKFIGAPNVPFKTDDANPKGIINCPYCKVGDRLWVREIFNCNEEGIAYKATQPDMDGLPWKSPIYMPRTYSRITLEITDIRVERVQEITEDDALAEGIISNEEYEARASEDNLFPCPRCKGYKVHEAFGYDYGITEVDCTYCNTQKKRYRIIWDSLNAKRGYPWESNPWVWVISFKQIHNQKEDV